jgi:tight adherence protein C
LSSLLAAMAGALAGAGAARLVYDALHDARMSLPREASAVPVAALTALARIGTRLSPARMLTARGASGDVAARLAAAGQPAVIGTREWIGLKCCAAAAAGVCALASAGALPGRLPVLAVAAGPVAGFVAPDYWLGRVTQRRLRAAGGEFAPMLDLLQVTVEAGAAPAAAMGAVGGRFSGPLAAEWRAAAAAISLGAPQERALAALTRRLPSPQARSFADAMRRARTRGLPLAEVLARQAASARHDEQIRIRERAARAGPKIQLVVAFVLVPSVMLIVAAALIAELTAPGVAISY